MMPFQLRQFELRNKIASGGIGTVYRAWDSKLERLVAVKLLKPEWRDDAAALESFYKEARACAGLNHTNIVHIYTYDEFENKRYLVMELADHGSLDDRIEKYKVLPELEVLDIGIKIASALNLILKHNMLHRDIKPGNILFNGDHEPKLVDFGLAHDIDAEPDPTDVVWGTPFYIAPERVRREKETFLSDMYSLGTTLYHAITGHVPLDGATPEDVIAAQVNVVPTSANLVVTDITATTSAILDRMLAKEPSLRFLSYDELIMTLTGARSELLVSLYRTPMAPEAKRTTSWWSWQRKPKA